MDGPWPIDEFARLAGTTSRNVRLYQTRGLLPPPAREGRAGLYGPDHLARLRLILRLLSRGYPLSVMRELLDAYEANRSLGDVLGFERALSERFTPEEPRHYTAGELEAVLPVEPDPMLLQRAVDLGLIIRDGEGYIVPVPGLVEVGADLLATGVPLAVVVESGGEILAVADQLAEMSVRLFLDHAWEPFEAAGRPAEGWQELTAALERLRDAMPRAVLAAAGRALQVKVDETVGEIAERDARAAREAESRDAS
jgi:DNA-binding transcriptional MerR regulator